MVHSKIVHLGKHQISTCRITRTPNWYVLINISFAFLCVSSASRLKLSNGPVKLTGAYGEVLKGFKVFRQSQPFHFKHGGTIPELQLAYETWGQLNSERSNAIFLYTGLSASLSLIHI